MENTLKRIRLRKVLLLIAGLMLMLVWPTSNIHAMSHTETGTITINNLEDNATVNAYKIVDVTWNDAAQQPQEPMYVWVSEVANFIDTNPTYSSYKGTGNRVTEAFESTNAQAEKDFLEALANSVTLQSAGTANAVNGTAAINGLTMGMYLIKVTAPTGSVYIYQVTSAELLPHYDAGLNDWTLIDTTVNVKAAPNTATKTVDKETVAVGDTVTYTITTYIPSYPADIQDVSFSIIDTLETGLQLNKDSIQINGAPIGNDAVYSEAQQTNGLQFTLDLTDTYIKNNLGKKITVTYKATIGTEAFQNNPLVNEALVKYNDPSYVGGEQTITVPEEKVYTYGLDITKTNTGGDTLAGAEFSFYKADTTGTATGDPLKFTGGNGTYTYDPVNGSATTLITGTDGRLRIQGIDIGTYILRETKAPGDYVLPENQDVIVTLQDGNTVDGILDSGSGAAGDIVDGTIMDQNADNVLEFGVKNISEEEAAFELPKTGGVGTLLFTVGGILLMAGAGIFFVVTRKKG